MLIHSSDIYLYNFGVRFSRKMFLCPNDVERWWNWHDASINALLRVKKIASSKGIRKDALKSYFVKAVKYECIRLNEVTLKHKSLNTLNPITEEEVIDNVQSQQTFDIETEEMFSKIRLAVSRLNSWDWNICKLVWVEGLSAKEASIHQQCSIHRIDTALRNSRIFLINELKDYA